MELVPDPSDLVKRREFEISIVEGLDKQIGEILFRRHMHQRRIQHYDALLAGGPLIQSDANLVLELEWVDHDGAA